MQLVTADVTLDDGGADVDGTLGVAICANALSGAAATIAAAMRITTPRMTASIAA